ncbi:MAG: hypothetical protein HDS37_06405 [Bacteroides sp.]|nr:hypothetical protein [Bacteroides sp.]
MNNSDGNNQGHHSKLWLNTVYILKAHILNPIWKDRDSRRKTRYDATYRFVMDYLQRYADDVRNFDAGKTDVADEPERAFTIWFQGEDEAPALVKACFRSMRRHLKQELVILDEKSLFEWISLPDYIIDKWKKGAITHAAFSDICRVELLYQHGGVWLDATDFVTAPIPESIMNEDFFVFMAGKKVRGNYAKIQSCFMRGRKGNPILSVWRKAIYLYWKKENRKINYFWMHFLLRLVVENNEVARREFSKMPKIDQDPTHELWEAHAGDIYDKDEFNRICDGSFFQKTNFKDKRLRNVPFGSVAQHVLDSNL